MTFLHDPYQGSTLDFAELALAVPAFAPFVRKTSKGLSTINFKDDQAVRALTAALLKRDFDLEITLPPDRLCPMVPGRLEYLLWIMNIALSTRTDPAGLTDPLTGLDIGTGSSCIYPLLGCRTMPSMQFVATDVDGHSLAFAKQNIEKNKLDQRIRLIASDMHGSLLPAARTAAVGSVTEKFDFTMCNPPFYGSEAEVAASASAKASDPRAVCTGGALEMITPGGEVAFVSRIVDESCSHGGTSRWFSSLLGKHSSLESIVDRLKTRHIENYTVHELGQGQTKRWVIAWSLQDARLTSSQYHSSQNHAIAKFLPPSNRHTYWAPAVLSIEQVRQCLHNALSSLAGVTVDQNSSAWSGDSCSFAATSNSWSRSARRGGAMNVDDTTGLPVQLVLGGRCQVEVGHEGQVKVTAEWTRGLDSRRADWTSLWSFLIRKLAAEAKTTSK